MPVFEKGNKAAVKSHRVIIRKVNEMLKNAEQDDEILCFGDALNSVKMRLSKFQYWSERVPVLGELKKDIQDAIIRRVNRNALKNKFNSTAAIWRQKQLGERDTQFQEITGKDGRDIQQAPPVIVFQDFGETNEE